MNLSVDSTRNDQALKRCPVIMTHIPGGRCLDLGVPRFPVMRFAVVAPVGCLWQVKWICNRATEVRQEFGA
jgi:hypothetical protein